MYAYGFVGTNKFTAANGEANFKLNKYSLNLFCKHSEFNGIKHTIYIIQNSCCFSDHVNQIRHKNLFKSAEDTAQIKEDLCTYTYMDM